MHVEIDIRDFYTLKELGYYANQCVEALSDDEDITRRWEASRFAIIRDKLDVVIGNAQIKHAV